ncbi:MAG TPA: hypothetical protein VMN38_07360 [Sphingomicrobium sp.]|nr:hypothetical protein [Sphingomicrobium sp.]
MIEITVFGASKGLLDEERFYDHEHRSATGASLGGSYGLSLSPDVEPVHKVHIGTAEGWGEVGNPSAATRRKSDELQAEGLGRRAGA